jgi:hypothetical protein
MSSHQKHAVTAFKRSWHPKTLAGSCGATKPWSIYGPPGDTRVRALPGCTDTHLEVVWQLCPASIPRVHCDCKKSNSNSNTATRVLIHARTLWG